MNEKPKMALFVLRGLIFRYSGRDMVDLILLAAMIQGVAE
jgi:hypothetical protein